MKKTIKVTIGKSVVAPIMYKMIALSSPIKTPHAQKNKNFILEYFLKLGKSVGLQQ